MTDIVKKVTGQDVHTQMRSAVLNPLHIRDSGFRLADADTEPAAGYASAIGGEVRNGLPYNYAYLYADLQGDPFIRGFVEYTPYTYDVFADGGMRTSALSLAVYSAMWANRGISSRGSRILSKKAVASAFSLQGGVGQGTADLGQGLGWGVDSRRPDGWVHEGGDLGANSFALILPERATSIIAISNVSRFPGGVGELVFGIADRAKL